MIYFDNMSITQPDKRVLRAIKPIYKKYWGNPSSSHTFGRIAKKYIEDTRETIANILNCNPDELFFVSNSSFANNMIAKGLNNKKYNFVASPLSHHSLEEYINRPLSQTKINIISIPYINNETGDIVELDNTTLYHLDLTATIGKTPIDLHSMFNVVSATLNATKINGVTGGAILYIKQKYIKDMRPLVFGSQEKEMVGGTENVAGIVGLGKAIELATLEMNKNNKKINKVVDYIYNNIPVYYCNYPHGSIFFTDEDNPYLPYIITQDGIKKKHKSNHIINITFKHLLGATAVQIFDQYGISISAGSACNSDDEKPSHTLLHSAYNELEALRTIRISLGKQNTRKEAQRFIKVLKEVIKEYDVD